MILWLALGAALAGLVVLALMPLTLSCNLQGKAEPSGAWAVAVGLGCGPLALSAIAAAGVKPFLTCHLFGKQIARFPISRWVRRTRARPAPSAPELEAEKAPALTRIERHIGGWFSGLDPLETLLSWWQKERIVQVRSLVIDVDYSFRDVALTGRILAGLYMVSAILPDVCQIHQTPSWESEDRLALGVDARFKIWPGRLVLDVARFVLKQRAQARHRAALAKRAAEPT